MHAQRHADIRHPTHTTNTQSIKIHTQLVTTTLRVHTCTQRPTHTHTKCTHVHRLFWQEYDWSHERPDSGLSPMARHASTTTEDTVPRERGSLYTTNWPNLDVVHPHTHARPRARTSRTPTHSLWGICFMVNFLFSFCFCVYARQTICHPIIKLLNGLSWGSAVSTSTFA